MGLKRSLICLSCVWLLQLINNVDGVAVETQEDLGGISVATSITVACLSVVILVFIVSLCGGCTPMEVGSDDHAAAGGVKHGGNHGQYDSVATDANTRVLTAGTSLPNDPYQHQDHSLPYDLHPAGNTAQTFAGYAPVQQPGGQMPSYGGQAAGYGGQAAGYGGQAEGYGGQTGGYSGQAAGYGQSAPARQHSQQGNYQGAHRPAYESEPPPPGYTEATGATAPPPPQPTQQQGYGW